MTPKQKHDVDIVKRVAIEMAAFGHKRACEIGDGFPTFAAAVQLMYASCLDQLSEEGRNRINKSTLKMAATP